MTDDMKVRPPRWVRATISFDLLVSPDWQNAVLDSVRQVVEQEFTTGLVAQYSTAEEFLARPPHPLRRPKASDQSPVDHDHEGPFDICGRCGYERVDHERGNADA
jgi:hypothetical protein